MRTDLCAILATVALVAAPMAAGSVAEAVQRATTEGCASPTDGMAQVTVAESPWTKAVAVDALGGRPMDEAVKRFEVAFFHRGEQRFASTGADGEETGVVLRDCSSGVCTVEIHVYEHTTTSTQTGAGVLAFLPFFFAVGGWTTVEQKVEVTEETKIACDGQLYSSLDFSGGVGPQVAAATVQKTNAEQMHGTCDYDNVLRTGCSVLFTGAFSVAANHAGRYTRFDVLNGGRFARDVAAEAFGVSASVSCTPAVTYDDPAHGVEREVLASECFGTAGEWRAIFGAIHLETDTTEAKALLEGGLP